MMRSKSLGGTGIPYELATTIYIIRASSEYSDWRKAILARAKYRCAISGNHSKTLQVHHIIPLNVLIKQYDITNENYMDYSDILFDLDNGIVLSSDLHQKLHNIYGYDTDNKILLEFINMYKEVM